MIGWDVTAAQVMSVPGYVAKNFGTYVRTYAENDTR